MFAKEVYWQRRKMLRETVGDGVILFPGNDESAMNYRGNTTFGRTAVFLYFFGISKPGFYGVCDVDENKDTLYGDDFTIDDIIWMGEQPAVKQLAAEVAVESSASLTELETFLKEAMKKGRYS